MRFNILYESNNCNQYNESIVISVANKGFMYEVIESVFCQVIFAIRRINYQEYHTILLLLDKFFSDMVRKDKLYIIQPTKCLALDRYSLTDQWECIYFYTYLTWTFISMIIIISLSLLLV